jgi:hypothetical protein
VRAIAVLERAGLRNRGLDDVESIKKEFLSELVLKRALLEEIRVLVRRNGDLSRLLTRGTSAGARFDGMAALTGSRGVLVTPGMVLSVWKMGGRVQGGHSRALEASREREEANCCGRTQPRSGHSAAPASTSEFLSALKPLVYRKEDYPHSAVGDRITVPGGISGFVFGG